MNRQQFYKSKQWLNFRQLIIAQRTEAREQPMIKKLMSVITLIHEKGLDTAPPNPLIKQIPYWTEFLDEELGTLDYSAEVSFIKNLGYRVFRNSEGKHKLVYEETKEL